MLILFPQSCTANELIAAGQNGKLHVFVCARRKREFVRGKEEENINEVIDV